MYTRLEWMDTYTFFITNMYKFQYTFNENKKNLVYKI